MLHVDLLCLIARERKLDAVKQPTLAIVEPLSLIKKVGPELPASEEQPVASTCAHRISFGNESSERCYPCAWADHDDGSARIGWQPEVRIAMQIDRRSCGLAVQVCQLTRCHPILPDTFDFELDQGDR
jgi:hypothetical protein